MQIILASTSQNRQEILEISKIPFKVVASKADESILKNKTFNSFKERVLAITALKMQNVIPKISDNNSIIITADGFNTCDGKILEKPQNQQIAKQMLKKLSDNHTVFYSGLIMYNTHIKQTFKYVTETTAWFRQLTDLEIDDYINTVAVEKYAAAYSPLNTKAITFIKKIEGSLSGFSHSLPMDVVIKQLHAWNSI